MTVRDFLTAFKSREIKITISSAGEDLIKFYSEGYTGVESDILDKTISKWELTSTTSITIYLDESTDNSDPIDPTDP